MGHAPEHFQRLLHALPGSFARQLAYESHPARVPLTVFWVEQPRAWRDCAVACARNVAAQPADAGRRPGPAGPFGCVVQLAAKGSESERGGSERARARWRPLDSQERLRLGEFEGGVHGGSYHVSAVSLGPEKRPKWWVEGCCLFLCAGVAEGLSFWMRLRMHDGTHVALVCIDGFPDDWSSC